MTSKELDNLALKVYSAQFAGLLLELPHSETITAALAMLRAANTVIAVAIPVKDYGNFIDDCYNAMLGDASQAHFEMQKSNEARHA